MAISTGKRFEADIKKSVPSYTLLYRLPDSAQAFGGSSNLRFSSKNPFDYLMWDSKKHILYALELKTVAGKAISFERSKDESGEIHWHQIEGLNKWNKYDGIICGFLIEFRENETTIFIDIDSFNELIKKIDKKSFTLIDLQKNEIPYLVISQKKKRTRYMYDIEQFLNDIENHITKLNKQKNTGGTQNEI